jgi:hypothetical protein
MPPAYDLSADESPKMSRFARFFGSVAEHPHDNLDYLTQRSYLS